MLKTWQQKLDEISRLGPGWDQEDALRPHPRAIEKAREIGSGAEPPPNNVVPCSDGGIQLEWHNLEIEISPDGGIGLLVHGIEPWTEIHW